MSATSSNRTFQRSTSKTVRRLICSGDIDSVKSLIDKLNDATDALELKALRDLVRLSIDRFSQLVRESIETVSDADVQEYIAIGQLSVRSPLDKQLLQSWFSSLCNSLRGREGEVKIVTGLECALLFVDKSIFKEDPGQLIRLAKSLLSKLDPDNTTFTKETYGMHRATLCALHQTLVILQLVSPKLLDARSEGRIYQMASWMRTPCLACEAQSNECATGSGLNAHLGCRKGSVGELRWQIAVEQRLLLLRLCVST